MSQIALHAIKFLREPAGFEMLRAAMAGDPQLAPDAAQLARTLYFGSGELARRSATAADMEADLGAFAAAYLTGVRAIATGSNPAPRASLPGATRVASVRVKSTRGKSAPRGVSRKRAGTH